MTRFADGEVYFQLLENVRGADVFVVQPTCYPVDQHLMELLIMIDALKRASAGRITVVVPYYGYARQDRKDRGRVAISSKLVADLMTTAGANRALFMDLHAAQIQAFFNISVVLALVPTKGITLPFISYGGTSLFIMLALIGVLLNITREIE